MIMEIGIVAGEIWHCLDDKTEVMLSDLVKVLDKSRDITLMSLGWLAREGYVTVEKVEDYKIKLRK